MSTPCTLCVVGRLGTLTLPKYLSKSSTKRWMISNTISSLSVESIPTQKYKLAYLHRKRRKSDKVGGGKYGW